jgi:hypothetical protein
VPVFFLLLKRRALRHGILDARDKTSSEA